MRIHGTRDQKLAGDQPGILAGGDDGPDDAGEKHGTTLLTGNAGYDFATELALPMGRASSRFECGRGMTCTETSSPTRRAAAAPASVAALTAATSPRTMAVTYPAPIFSQPTSVTLAALTMASAASIMATRPLVSTIPNASPIGVPRHSLRFFTASAMSAVSSPYVSRISPSLLAWRNAFCTSGTSRSGESGDSST